LRNSLPLIWNPDLEAYDVKDLQTGKFVGVLGSGAFLAYLAGASNPELDAQLMRVWNAVRYGIPSADPEAPIFDPRRYWRGPTWPVINALMAIGLRHSGREDLEERLRAETAELIEKHGFFEYFDPCDATPRGGDSFTWTADMGRLCAGSGERDHLMSSIELKAVEKWFGNVQVIKGVDLTIEEGEFVIFVGPSGCGKSTLLRMIVGLEETSRGRIMIGDRDATAEPPSKRGLAMVFQSYALYPHMSVRDNVGFPLKSAGLPKSEIDAKVNEAGRVLKLDSYMDRRPKDLSGGQRQRVAIGRSIVRDPTAFLFDEPLSNLDASLRVEMRYEIAKLHQTLKSTMIYVTHDQVEAMTLADRIVVLEFGKIAQVGTPRELYEKPANLFVAQFIGSPRMNVIPVSAVPSINLPPEVTSLGIRSEHITLVGEGAGQLQGTVDVLEYLGADTFLIMACGEAEHVTVRVNGDVDLKPGDKAGLEFLPEKLHGFDRDNLAVSVDI
jgi:multiple sugar transport system ATP-binding protein